MRLLGAFLAGVGIRPLGQVLRPVARDDLAAQVLQRLGADAHAVGTHVGDQAFQPAGDLHAFVELLRHAHRAARRPAELARGVLLHRGGGERRLRAARMQARGAARRAVAVAHHVGDQRLRFLAVGDHTRGAAVGFLLAALLLARARQAQVVEAHQLGLEALGALAFELRDEGPVFVGAEGADLLLALADQLDRHALHAAGGKPGLDLAPHQRADLVAHQAVQHTARLLRVDAVVVDVARVFQRFQHGLARDLMELYAVYLALEQLGDVPGDGLALAVRVGRQVNLIGVLDRVADRLDDLGLAFDHLVLRLEVVFDLHAQAAFGQIADVADRGDHDEVAAQIAADGAGLGRRLND